MTDPASRDSVDDRLNLGNLSRGEFITAIAHLYRGELGEATAWRTRIDTTSNWAVVVSVAALSFIFADNRSENHVVVLIVIAFCTFLLFMEARRYRFYDIWRSRARILEMNFYRPMLEGTPPTMPNWAEALAQDLEWPRFHMPWWEATGRRLRRNYQWIFAILLASWLIVLTSHPTASTALPVLVKRAAVGPVPGGIVMSGVLIFYASLLALGVYSYWASRIHKSLPAGHPERLLRARE
jgi:uncharacterized membrane protein